MTAKGEKEPKTIGEQLDQYFTHPLVARKIVEWSQLSRGLNVLEPSAGDGAITRHLPKNVRLTCVELDPEMAKRLSGHSKHPARTVVQVDFLDFRPQDRFDVAVMNPPYGEGRDGRHVRHALKLADRVVVLVRANFLFGKTRYHEVFRWAELTRLAIFVHRPPFYGPADKGHGARHEYVAAELVALEQERGTETLDRPEVEWWVERWE